VKRLRVDEGEHWLLEAAGVIRVGGIVAIPTDTLYGLAADPFQDAAVARIFAVKDRSAERALPLIAADAVQVQECVGPIPPLAARLVNRFWPGPLTLLLPAPARLGARGTGGPGNGGVRVPAHAVARRLCAACGTPLTATSANRSGEPPSADPDAVARALGDRIDVLVDAGFTPGGPPSTIVDVSGASPRLVRAGAIAWEDVQRYLA
jgi:L-threonylcarbamoyladenylate synthase